eukprot:752055-Hanusia_phi.AAC.1
MSERESGGKGKDGGQEEEEEFSIGKHQIRRITTKGKWPGQKEERRRREGGDKKEEEEMGKREGEEEQKTRGRAEQSRAEQSRRRRESQEQTERLARTIHLLVEHLVKNRHEPFLEATVVLVGYKHVPDPVQPLHSQCLAVEIESAGHMGMEWIPVQISVSARILPCLGIIESTIVCTNRSILIISTITSIPIHTNFHVICFSLTSFAVSDSVLSYISSSSLPPSLPLLHLLLASDVCRRQALDEVFLNTSSSSHDHVNHFVLAEVSDRLSDPARSHVARVPQEDGRLHFASRFRTPQLLVLVLRYRLIAACSKQSTHQHAHEIASSFSTRHQPQEI